MFPPFNFFGNDAVKYIIEADDATSDNKGRFTIIFLLCCSSSRWQQYCSVLLIYYTAILSSELSTYFLHSKTDNWSLSDPSSMKCSMTISPFFFVFIEERQSKTWTFIRVVWDRNVSQYLLKFREPYDNFVIQIPYAREYKRGSSNLLKDLLRGLLI